ncbi:hypothetical protein HanXRQr2_Chr10g0440871 [Helianthus annuus]|uniref:Uncharacterized protein n=1 Tax=Helianthus annuus TaxID=4232 RepID=A0A251TJZ7_HELAN|nr:hypothetical protein HanXRQr2_Chr10g0440871 [Helianthus annuus]
MQLHTTAAFTVEAFSFLCYNFSYSSRRFANRDVDCMQICFRIPLESINSSDPQRNVCTLATSSIEERRTWKY